MSALDIDKKRRGNSVNWETVRQAYIAGAKWEDMEQTFKVSRGALQRHIKKESWEAQRKEYQEQIANKVLEIQTQRTVKSMIEFNAMVEDSVDKVARITAKIIDYFDNSMQEQDNRFPKSKELQELLATQEKAVNIKRLINNIPPPSASQERSEEFDEYSRELARLHFARTNGEPVDPQKPMIVKIEKPQSLKRVN